MNKNQDLYVKCKDRIFQDILKGIYKEGDFLPSERMLVEKYKLSRITIRKALQLLQQEKLISREHGRGNRVTYNTTGYTGNMDLITLIGSITTPFFSKFIESFEAHAEKQDALVVFKQLKVDKGISTASIINRLIKAGVRHIVLWSHNQELDKEALEKARGLGCNIVIFDEVQKSNFADCLALDNEHAIKTLAKKIEAKGKNNLYYIGWSDLDMSGNIEREDIFRKNCKGEVYHVSWKKKLDVEIKKFISIKKPKSRDAIICGNGDIALALRKYISKSITLASVDYFPEMKNSNIIAIEQPISAFGEKAFELLEIQRKKGKEWKSGIVKLKGKLISE